MLRTSIYTEEGGRKFMVSHTPVGPVCTDMAERIRKVLAEISAEVEELAQVIIDRYWLEFRRKNRDQRHLPEGQRQLGRYGPYLRKHKVNNKVYIGWRNYQPTRKGERKGRVLSVDIKPARSLHYTEKQFTKNARPWEFALIVRTERELAALRDLQEGIHKHVVHMARSERTFEWKLQQQNDKKSNPTPTSMTEKDKEVVRKTIEQYEAELRQERVINPIEHM